MELHNISQDNFSAFLISYANLYLFVLKILLQLLNFIIIIIIIIKNY